MLGTTIPIWWLGLLALRFFAHSAIACISVSESGNENDLGELLGNNGLIVLHLRASNRFFCSGVDFLKP